MEIGLIIKAVIYSSALHLLFFIFFYMCMCVFPSWTEVDVVYDSVSVTYKLQNLGGPGWGDTSMVLPI